MMPVAKGENCDLIPDSYACKRCTRLCQTCVFPDGARGISCSIAMQGNLECYPTLAPVKLSERYTSRL
ncbi:hypothetical protein BDV33DRAFT_181473 [Aspergillus novoparasiticus]|uniref:Uncharacterized protein n=1 Tax=Aspergillus novoparasiticus TaxID=986946 RepID=A0A5N6EBY4_9EURO|nr:hypothetical protein BDV33DRAFT_181473 [Aspergillus novoparasiticus]